MECLQRAIVPETTGTADPKGNGGSSCDDLRRKAFDSYAECYSQPSGEPLYTLSVKDWDEIVEIVGLKTLFERWEASKDPEVDFGGRGWMSGTSCIFFTQFSVTLLSSIVSKPECHYLFPLIL